MPEFRAATAPPTPAPAEATTAGSPPAAGGSSAAVLEPPAAEPRRSRRASLSGLARGDTGRAAGLAGAMIANNVIALLTTIVFARLLGASAYGSLGALLAAFIILMVPGSAIQAAVAREVTAAVAAGSDDPAAGVRRWLARLGVTLVAVTALSIALRGQVAAVIGVSGLGWTAAAVVPTGWLWLVLCVERGALQAFGRYRLVGLSLVGEAGSRLVAGLGLVLAGAAVAGAFLATTASLVAMMVALALPLHRALVASEGRRGAERAAVSRLRDLLRRSWVPILAFSLIAVLQHGDVIVVKHLATPALAGSYAATSVAGKAIIWVAIGLGLYVLPETVRRAQAGTDPRPVLLRTLAVLAAMAVPAVLIYVVAGKPLLGVVFGPGLTRASTALPILGAGMALLATGYLCVQYLLALGRARFIGLLAVAAAVEFAVLLQVGAHVTAVAVVILAVEAGLAAALFLTAMRAPWRGEGDAPAPGVGEAVAAESAATAESVASP